jgi:diguanylate cyclase (GGDEF)-like protein
MEPLTLPQQLAKLQAASENISSVLNPREVLNVITREFASLLPASAVSLSRLDEATDMLVVVSEYEGGQWIDTELGKGFPLSEYIFTESVLKHKEIKQFIINDPAIEPSEQDLLQSYGMKTILLIPFVKQEQLIGLVEVYHRDEIIYDENDLMMARLLSSTAAVAFENATLFQQIQQSYIQQKALHDSAIIITSSLDLDTILTKISEQVCRLLDVTSVYISNYDPETQTYCILAEAFSEHASEAERKSDLGTTYNYIPESGEGTEPVKPHRLQYYHISDPDLHPHRYQHLQKFGGNSVLEIPLRASGKMNAIIMVWESRYQRDFTAQEIALCETIALQASIALENATLYYQTQEELKQRKKLEEEFRHKALHDVLTHLPNRVLFTDRLEQAIKKKNRNPQADFAVFFIDLDNFKQVNDTFGHAEGDRVLEIVAKRFGCIIREVDTVARYGGDEFLMLVEDVVDDDNANRFTERVEQKLNQPIMINDKIIRLTCSIGYTISTQGLKTSQDYINGADDFMYTAKHLSKKNQKLVVEPVMISPAEIASIDWLGLEQ